MNSHSVVRFAVPSVIAVIVGPLVASVGLWLLSATWDPLDLFNPASPFSFAYEGGTAAIVIMVYVIGGPIALLFGFLLSLWMIWRPPSRLAVNATAVIATAVCLGVTVGGGLVDLVKYSDMRRDLLLTLGFALLAANVCWLVLRRFARPAPARSPL